MKSKSLSELINSELNWTEMNRDVNETRLARKSKKFSISIITFLAHREFQESQYKRQRRVFCSAVRPSCGRWFTTIYSQLRLTELGETKVAAQPPHLTCTASAAGFKLEWAPKRLKPPMFRSFQFDLKLDKHPPAAALAVKTAHWERTRTFTGQQHPLKFICLGILMCANTAYYTACCDMSCFSLIYIPVTDGSREQTKQQESAPQAL